MKLIPHGIIIRLLLRFNQTMLLFFDFQLMNGLFLNTKWFKFMQPHMKKNFTRILLLIILLLSGLFVASQEKTPEPPARLITEFTFHQFSGGVVIIKAFAEQLP